MIELKLKWWQAGLYEVSVLSLGILIGLKWPGLFEDHVIWLMLVFAVGASYVLGLWLGQSKK